MKPSPAMIWVGSRRQYWSPRRVSVQASARVQRSVLAGHAASSSRSCRGSGGRVAGQVQERLVEGRSADADVLGLDPGGVELAEQRRQGRHPVADRRARPGARRDRRRARCAGDPGERSAAASASVVASRTTHSRRSPPTRALSSSGVPSAMTRPRSTTLIRSASWSASSRYCVVSSTVVPSRTSARMADQTSFRPRGSSPVVGSSRNRTAGARIRLAARSSRRRIPPEYRLTGRSAASSRPNRASSSSARRRAAGRPEVEQPPEHDQVLAAAQRLVERGVLARPARSAAAPRRPPGATSWPATSAMPPSGRTSVARIRTAVVLPAPFGPSRPQTVPAATSRSKPSSAGRRSVALHQADRPDRRATSVPPIARLLLHTVYGVCAA